MLVMTLLISSCFAFLQKGLLHTEPLLFGALRALIAGLVLLVFLGLSGKSIKLSQALLLKLFPIALFSTTFTFGAMFESSKFAPTGIGTLLANLQPFFLSLLGILFLKETMDKKTSWVFLLGFIGVLFISYKHLEGQSSSGLGILLALLTSLSSSMGSLLIKKAAPTQLEILPLTAWQLILGSLPLFILAQYIEPTNQIHWTTDFILILMYLSILGTALTVSLWFHLLQQFETQELSPYLLLTPLFGLSIALFILKESLYGSELIGATLIIICLILKLRKNNTPNESQSI